MASFGTYGVVCLGAGHNFHCWRALRRRGPRLEDLGELDAAARLDLLSSDFYNYHPTLKNLPPELRR